MYLNVPENKTGSWGIIEILVRNFSRDICFVFISSILIIPSIGANLKSADIKEDFPATVLPTTPTYNKKYVF